MKDGRGGNWPEEEIVEEEEKKACGETHRKCRSCKCKRGGGALSESNNNHILYVCTRTSVLYYITLPPTTAAVLSRAWVGERSRDREWIGKQKCFSKCAAAEQRKLTIDTQTEVAIAIKVCLWSRRGGGGEE